MANCQMDNISSNVILARTLMTSLKTPQDKQKVLRWLRKLTNIGRNIEDQIIANDFLYELISNLQMGELSPPFTSDPPYGSIKAIGQLLLNRGDNVFSGHIDPTRGQWAEDMDKATPTRPMLYKLSPDGGAFLSAQPVPKRGAFCYVAAVWNPRKTD